MTTTNHIFILLGIALASIATVLEPVGNLRGTTDIGSSVDLWVRVGLVTYGIVVVVAAMRNLGQRKWVRGPLVIFGVGALTGGVWVHAPDAHAAEQWSLHIWTHALAASLVGLGIVASSCGRLFGPDRQVDEKVAWAVLLSVTLLLILADLVPALHGLCERLIFVVSFVYVWDEFRRPREGHIS